MREYGDTMSERVYVVRIPEIENGDFAISARVLKEQLERCASTDENACKSCIFDDMSQPWYLCGRLMAKSAAVVVEGQQRRIEELSAMGNGLPPFKIGDKLYFISRNKVHERTICGYSVTENGYEIMARLSELIGSIRFYEKDVGNTVFFDEKAADDRLMEILQNGR